MTDHSAIIKVGISDMKIVTAPDFIRTSGLGSCVGIVIYDQMREIAGLSHIMLPDSKLAKQDSINIWKYADTAIPELIRKLVNAGAKKTFLKAKIAGGAQMFQFSTASEIMRIGPRNVEAVKKLLMASNIDLVAEDTGGNRGRTIEFNPKTAVLMIRTANKEIYQL
ncbi:chemotaxis protein CheD [Bacillaceae bacterium Marseille-Q3522]|nr:chemotaxis protein CheD [Bacillaceae bacterium Marseille-Q3522]